ncbi:MAG: hypothetical protein Kow0092_05750 [Deferrisomatales bacterium]
MSRDPAAPAPGAKWLRAWNRLEEAVLGWTLLGLALLSFLQVVLRYGFSSGFDWAEEFGRYTSIFLTFLGASLGVKHGTHFSVKVVVDALPPRPSRLLQALAALLSAALFAAVAWYGWVHVAKLHRFGVSSASLRVPMWIPYAAIPALSVSIALRFALDALRHVKGGVDRVAASSTE